MLIHGYRLSSACSCDSMHCIHRSDGWKWPNSEALVPTIEKKSKWLLPKQWHVVSVPVHMDMHTQPWLSELWDEIWILVNKWEYKEKERTWRSWEPNRSNWCLQLRESWQNGGTSDCGGMQNKTESVACLGHGDRMVSYLFVLYPVEDSQNS